MEQFQRYGFLWMRLPATNNAANKNIKPSLDSSATILSELRENHNQDPDCLKRKWSVENSGSCPNEEEKLSADAILLADDCDGEHSTAIKKIFPERFYVSTIISRKDQASLRKLLRLALKPYLNTKDNDNEIDDNENGDYEITPPLTLLRECQHKGGAWLFLGRNCPANISESSKDSTTNEPAPKKHKSNTATSRSPLIGRAEHVDDVLHSGTWHLQLSGTKTWYLRPNSDSEDWQDSDDEGGVPDLRTYLGCNTGGQHNVIQVQKSEGGQVRLCCHVQEGDLFILNTKAWYHRTELPVDNHPQQRWSMSIARDFNLPIPAFPCPRDVKEGAIILEENDIPDQFPTVESHDDEPNCAMAEVSLEEIGEESNDQDEDDEEAPTTSIVVVALRDIAKDEPLLLQKMEDDDSDEEEENAPESIDPRAIAKADWKVGETVLSGDEIPEDLPLSLEPNCRLVETADGELSLQCIRPVASHDIFTIAPEEDDNLEDYEEVEVDLGKGELRRGI